MSEKQEDILRDVAAYVLYSRDQHAEPQVRIALTALAGCIALNDAANTKQFGALTSEHYAQVDKLTGKDITP